MDQRNKQLCNYSQEFICDYKLKVDKGNRFRADISKTTKNCIGEVNANGEITEVCGKVEETFGQPAHFVIGRRFHQFFALEDGSSTKNIFDNLLIQKNEVTDLRLIRFDENDNKIHFLLNAVPYYSQEGKFGGFRGITQNITKLVQTQDRLEQLNRELENKNIALSEILSRVKVEKDEIYHNLAANIEKFIKPLLRSLTTSSNLNQTQLRSIESIEQLLNRLNWDFYKKIDHLRLCLTPSEIQVCRLLQSNHSLKEVAAIQSISLETAKTHCKNIRKKVGLKGQKTSLASFFQQL